MKEKIDFSIRKGIRTSQDIKKRARQDEIPLFGNPGKNINQIKGEVAMELSVVMSENQEWINEQKEKIKKLFPDLNDTELLKSFEDGLMTFFKQQYRLFTYDPDTRKREIPLILQNKIYIQEQITAFTFDFIQLLKSAQKMGMTSKQAIEVAKLSCHYDPDILRKLKAKYPDIGKWVINHAIIGYPSNPGKLIDDFIENTKKFEVKYPDVFPYVIKYAVLRQPTAPETFIKSFIKRRDELYLIYPAVAKGIINQYALSEMPEAKKFIDHYILDFKRLTSQYPKVGSRAISQAIRVRPGNPESYIEEHKNDKVSDSGVIGDEDEE